MCKDTLYSPNNVYHSNKKGLSKSTIDG